MPLFMDIHNSRGEVDPQTLAQAHINNITPEQVGNVDYLQCWYDKKETGKVLCLFEAPDLETVRSAHGGTESAPGDEIIEVTEAMTGFGRP